jgi:cation diffusion facilitator CzcD-associated flavoprotein CzcO
VANPKIALIGAGFAGLGVAAAFRRHGILYDHFDANPRIGGIWHAGAYEGTHTITSRRRTEYRDFPMPAGYPDFPSREQVLAYLESFADHHDLRGALRLGTRIQGLEPAGADRWRLRFESGEERVYAGAVIATGQHWDCRYPEYPGSFAGEVLHSGHYRSAEALRGKRVLVVGGGNSAADIAVDAARVAKEAHISMRRGRWYVPKTMCGIPSTELIKSWLPLSVQRLLFRTLLRLTVGSYESYGLERPAGRLFDTDPVINDQLLYWLRHGRITPHKVVRSLEGREVEFVDGSRRELDLLCYATGYRASIPFLQEGIVRFEDDVPNLAAGMFPLGRRNLYVFGIGRILPVPRYGVGPPITAGAELLALCVKAQERLNHSWSEIFCRLGGTPRPDRLIDSRTILLLVRLMSWCVPKMPALERWLFWNERRPTEGETIERGAA